MVTGTVYYKNNFVDNLDLIGPKIYNVTYDDCSAVKRFRHFIVNTSCVEIGNREFCHLLVILGVKSGGGDVFFNNNVGFWIFWWSGSCPSPQFFVKFAKVDFSGPLIYCKADHDCKQLSAEMVSQSLDAPNSVSV